MVTNGLQWTTSFLEGYRARTASDPANINNVFAFSREWYENLKEWDKKDTPNSERYDVNPANGRWRYYGNTSWYDIIYRDYTTGQTHNLTLSGGNDKANYFISGRFFQQNGIYNAAPAEDVCADDVPAVGVDRPPGADHAFPPAAGLHRLRRDPCEHIPYAQPPGLSYDPRKEP